MRQRVLVAFSMESEEREREREEKRFGGIIVSRPQNFLPSQIFVPTRVVVSRPDTLSTRLFFSLSNLLTPPLFAAALLFPPQSLARSRERGEKGSA